MLTSDEYVAKGGGCCPNCESGNIDGDSFEHGGSYVVQRVHCNECGALWDDVFVLDQYNALGLSENEV